MNRRRLFILLLAVSAWLFACNALLGIDGDVIDAVTPSADAGGDASNTDEPVPDVVSGDGSALHVDMPALALLQDETITISISRPGAPADTAVDVAISALPPGVRASPESFTLVADRAALVAIVADTFAPTTLAPVTARVAPTTGPVTSSTFSVSVSGPLDPTFGDGGSVAAGFDLAGDIPTVKEGNDERSPIGFALWPDAGPTVVFNSTISSGSGRGKIVRFGTNGAFDTSFGDAGAVLLPSGTRAYDIAFLVDGTPLVVGADYNGGTSAPAVFVATLSPAGALLSTATREELSNANESFHVVVARPDQGAIAARPQQPAFFNIAPDAAIPDAATGTLNVGGAVSLLAEPGRVLVIGENANAGRVVRRLFDGGIDPFGDGGTLTLAGAPNELRVGVHVDAGYLFAGNAAPDASDRIAFQLVRTSSAGALDQAFGDGGMVVVVPPGAIRVAAHALLVDDDGRFIVGGYIADGGKRKLALLRFDAQGALVPSFGRGGVFTCSLGLNNANEVRGLLRDGNALLVASVVTDKNGRREVVVVRALAP